MNLLVVFLIVLVIFQSISIGAGLMAERIFSPYTGLITFIVLYFGMFAAAWKLAVRLTEPKSSIGT
jgi:hypothetical protein